MFRKFSHALVAVFLHVAVLFAAHKLAVEIIGLVRDELIVTYGERMLAMF